MIAVTPAGRTSRLRHFTSVLVAMAMVVTSLVVVAEPTEAAPQGTTLYAVSGAGSSTAFLYELDPATGAVLEAIGPIGFDGVSSIAVHPFTGVAYGVANDAPGGPTLITINLDTGAGTAVGFTVNGSDIPDIEFSAGGVLYAWNEGGDDLYTIDTSTGLATLVGEAGISTLGTAIAFDPSGVLWLKTRSGGTDTAFYTVDTSTGAVTFQESLAGIALSNAFAFDESGTPFAVLRDAAAGGGPGTESHLYEIDPALTSASLVGDIGVVGISGITFANTAPVAFDDAATVQPGGSVWVNVVANDTDADDDALFVSSVLVAPLHGTATIQGGGIVYEHDGTGSSDTFIYQVSDANGATDQAMVIMSYVPCDAGGDLVNGSFETGTFEGWCSVDINNPFHPQGVRQSGTTPGFMVFESDPTDGTWAVTNGFDGDGPGTMELYQVVSLPADTLSAPLTFDWRAGWDLDTYCGGCTESRMFDVVISTPDGLTELVAINLLVANPSTINLDTGPQSEIINLLAYAGETFRITFRTTIPEDFTGPGHLQIDNVALDYVENTPPVAVDDPVTVAEGGVMMGDVTTNDIDPDPQTLTATKLSSPSYGTLAFSSDGTFTYTHDGSETSSDSFTYRVNDGFVNSNVATVNITVSAVDDPVRAVVLGGTGAVSDAVAADLASLTGNTVMRLAGTDRYSTAAEISAATFSPGVPVVFIAVGDNFPDALAGGPPAAIEGGPILLTAKDLLPGVTKAELARLDPGRIVVLGGTGVVSDAVMAELDAFTTGSVTRLAGSDRYSTAAAISAATFSPGVPVVYIAVGDNFPDALAGGPPAALGGGPILLTTKDVLPVATTAELARLDPAKIVVLGGTGVVSDGVVAQLAGFTTGSVTRLAGPDRYSTAAAISAATFPAGTDLVYVAVGTNFPDALAGVPVAALDGAPILLVATDTLPGATSSEIARIDAAK